MDGIELYANIGNSGALFPDKERNQYQAIPIYKGLGLNVNKEEAPVGTWIKLTIYSQPDVSLQLNAVLIQ